MTSSCDFMARTGPGWDSSRDSGRPECRSRPRRPEQGLTSCKFQTPQAPVERAAWGSNETSCMRRFARCPARGGPHCALAVLLICPYCKHELSRLRLRGT